MAWDHLSINKPHLVYIILGGFTSLFMLCSSIIKERLYIGEATVATLVGVIFGPHAANLINPNTWGNTDQITLEFARIVLVVQCFAVGVELPKYYMEKHWRSVVFLLVPVMTFGWLVTSLFIWAMFHTTANWLDSLCIAACVTATDPVLASSVVGKGKFAKRVPKHLRDILSAESGCNDGMAFPFIYLALYIIKYKDDPDSVALNWFCITILYECVFGAIYGVTIGYIARRLIRTAHERDYIDRESFLVFYFTLALFCAGSGSLLGMDDLLIGFACGVGFSNDGWFSEKTEETHVSNVIDLLLNLAFFVYFGTIIPWDAYNSGYFGLDVWKLVVIAFLVLFLRRIPAMMALKPLIPDVKTWREALFAGHFGPIGVGAIFVSILARAELEDGPLDGSVPVEVLPGPKFPHDNIIQLIWPITTFLVMTSILVHGSSIAVFTLGKHINTLALTMSYSRATDEPNWMDRLPRIQSRSKSSMSLQRSESSMDNEKGLPANMLPLASAGNFLRRQKETDNPSRVQSRSSSRHRTSRNKSWDGGRGPGGPISRSAISPTPRHASPAPEERQSRSDSDTLAMKSESSPSSNEKLEQDDNGSERGQDEAATPAEIYEEGSNTVYEDKDGNVLAVEPNAEETQLQRETSEIEESRRLGREASKEEHADPDENKRPKPDKRQTDERHELAKEKSPKSPGPGTEGTGQPGKRLREGVQKMSALGWLGKREDDQKPAKRSERKKEESKRESAPARAYQYGNTIILEDEDGEVIKKYEIPAPEGLEGPAQGSMRKKLEGVSKRFGVGAKVVKSQPGAPSTSDTAGASSAQSQQRRKGDDDDDDDDTLVRFTTGGRRMSKNDFIESFREMDPSRRIQAVEDSNLPESDKREVRREAREQKSMAKPDVPAVEEQREAEEDEEAFYTLGRTNTVESARMQSFTGEVPWHDVSRDLRRHQIRGRDGEETAAERRRRLALQNHHNDDDSDDDGTERVPPSARTDRTQPQDASSKPETAAEKRRRLGAVAQTSQGGSSGDYFSKAHGSDGPDARSPPQGETAAERRRREGALGHSKDDSDSEDDDQPRQLPQAPAPVHAAGESRPRQRTLRWASNVGRH